MTTYVEAPTEWHRRGVGRGSFASAVFLAGGITGCPDWQAQMRGLLADEALTILNPRRADFPIHDPSAAEAQIAWEHRHLRRASLISFWFCAATLCPIVLYELGAWSMTDKPIVVGVEPGYERERDVRIQTSLTRPDALPIVSTLSDLAAAVRVAAFR